MFQLVELVNGGEIKFYSSSKMLIIELSNLN